MPKRQHRCRRCGAWDHEVGRMSRSGLCETCGISARLQASIELQARSGPAYEAWVAGMERAQMNQAARYIARLSGQVTDSNAPPAG